MAGGKKNMAEFNEEIRKSNAALAEQIRLHEEELSSLSSIFDFREKMNLKAEIYRKEQEKLNNLNDIYLKALKDGNKIHGNTTKAYQDKVKAQRESVRNAEKEVKSQERILKAVTATNKIINSGALAKLGDYLMISDKPLREATLQLGLSGERAAILRENFEGAIGVASRLGGSMADLRDIQLAFSDETGRARLLTSQMLIDIEGIGRGTGLGVQNAGQLAGQFELMGLNARATSDYVLATVDMTNRMGVNTTKVLKTINKDFKKLQSYTFREGVKSMAQMASHAEKFSYDMGSMLDSADKARTLEGAVELASKLQVMGGEFAKTDPFEVLFLSRNDPAKYAEKINSMTRGIATFRKNADGAFESYISPMDMDRLDQVGKALGMQKGELTQQARRMAEIQKMRQQMLGMGIDDKDRQIIESLATYDNKKDRFFVEVGSQMKDISTLTSTQIKALQIEKTTLEENARNSLTFTEAWQSSMNEFKSALLPLIKGLNVVIKNITPILNGIGETISALSNSKFGEVLLTGAGILAGFGFMFKQTIAKLISNKIAGSATGTPAIGSATGGGGAGGGSTKGAFGKGAGVGAAGLGIGAGMGIAAVGIGKMAESMAKLDKTQIWALPATVLALSAGMWSLVPAIYAAGAAGSVGALGILAIGGAALGIGVGIGIAAAGIGYMANGLANLVISAKGSDGALMGIASGIVAINAAMATGGISMLFGGAVGMAGLVGLISTMSSNAEGISKVGNAFGNIAAVMSGTKEDFAQVERTVSALSKADIGDSGVISELITLLKSPLKVEFSDKEVGITANVSLNMDGRKVFENLNISKKVAINQLQLKQGKRG